MAQEVAVLGVLWEAQSVLQSEAVVVGVVGAGRETGFQSGMFPAAASESLSAKLKV